MNCNFSCRSGMEAEKITEFISYTKADPNLARQILQSMYRKIRNYVF